MIASHRVLKNIKKRNLDFYLVLTFSILFKLKFSLNFKVCGEILTLRSYNYRGNDFNLLKSLHRQLVKIEVKIASILVRSNGEIQLIRFIFVNCITEVFEADNESVNWIYKTLSRDERLLRGWSYRE